MQSIEDNIIYDEELFGTSANSGVNKNSISILHLKSNDISKQIGLSIYLRSTLFILVHKGNATALINFKKYDIQAGQILLLSFGHFLKVTQISDDFSFSSLYVTKEYIDEMYSTDMLYKKVKYAVRMFKNPVLRLDKAGYKTLYQRFNLIESIYEDINHIHYSEMILNALRIFFLDLRNSIDRIYKAIPEEKPSRDELYFEHFLNILVQEYKTQHKVDFYAEQIHITPHYLTKIIKRLTGQTVSNFIYQLVFREAQQLLKQPKLSIQEIAIALNFSDQSAFGKFFKRNAGISPKQYRLSVN